MRTNIQRWGNSLGVRIPKPFALQVALEENCEVDISIDGDRIILRVAQKDWQLDELLAGMTSDNLHKETDWGRTEGVEAW